jgi:hypothetical protein
VERGWGVNSWEDARHCSVLYMCEYFCVNNSPQTHSTGIDRQTHTRLSFIHVYRTVIGGDGRVRREMRFRTPSATRGEESAARGVNGAAEAAKLRRQQSEPMGHPPTPPSGMWKISCVFRFRNSWRLTLSSTVFGSFLLIYFFGC